MVTIGKVGNYLSISANYYYMNRIKAIPGAVFQKETKMWLAPISSISYIKANFETELVYQTPEWEILGESMPDMSYLYKLKNAVTCPVMKTKLYDYQEFGVKYLVDRILDYGFSICADDVGTGKTGTALGVIKWFIENIGYHKILLIVKKTIKTQWVQEFDKFTDISDTFTIAATGDSKAKRIKAYDTIKNAPNGILVTNYHNFLNDDDLIAQIPFSFVCIDEVHCIATRTGIINTKIKNIVHGKPTLMLTGTPIMNNPENIFSIIQVCNSSFFGLWKRFKNRYIVEENGIYGVQTVGGRNLPELREAIQQVLIRRTENEVSVSLPETRIQTIMCEMDKTQEKIQSMITQMQVDFAEELESYTDKSGTVIPGKQVLYDKAEAQSKGLIAAKQAVATDPRLFKITRSPFMQKTFGSMVPDNYKGSAKSMSIIEKVQDVLDSGKKIILFSKFWTSAYMIAQDIQVQLKVPVLMYTGQQNQEERDGVIWYFKNTNNYNVLIGTDAMAEGINLDLTPYMINIDQPDSLAIKTQRIGRIRRVSASYSHVIIYDMITAGSKDEERIRNIQNNENLTNALINLDSSQSKAIVDAMSQ